MNKIVTFIVSLIMLGFIFLNVIISSSSDSTKKYFNLYSIATAYADDGEGTGQKYAFRNTLSGTIPEECTINNNTYTRTCSFLEVTCIGTGDIDCTPSLTTHSCTKWVQQ